MGELKHSEFEADDYFFMPKLYEKRFYPDDPFLKKVFKDCPEILDELQWIGFVASEERENVKDWKDLAEYKIIKKRINRRRKSAWFFAFFRYQCNGYRGFVCSRACTAHTFKKFIYGKEAKSILSDAVKNIKEFYESKNEVKEDTF